MEVSWKINALKFQKKSFSVWVKNPWGKQNGRMFFHKNCIILYSVIGEDCCDEPRELLTSEKKKIYKNLKKKLAENSWLGKKAIFMTEEVCYATELESYMR